MSNIKSAFKNGKALIAFITCGDPDLETTAALMRAAVENGASMILTNAGDWNVDFFKKNGYLLRGELKDVPKGHDCYELYKNI